MDGNHHHHKFIYSEDERRKYEQPESILLSAGLKSGMTFIDIGCNDGFFTVPAAKIVGQRGRVLASDIDDEALLRLNDKLRQAGITNTKTYKSWGEEFLPETGIADLIFFGIVLHDFYDPIAVLNNCREMLVSQGSIYDFGWRKRASKMGPPLEKRLSEKQVEKMANEAGLKVIGSSILGEDFYSVRLAK